MTWKEWIDWFATLFGVREQALPTLAAWVNEVFVPGGMAPAEVRAAALEVVRAGPPSFLNEILPALLSAVRSARAADLMAREAQDRQGGGDVTVPGCKLCDGSGWVSVPQVPQPEGAGEKGYLRTCCVTCECIQGLRLSGVARNHLDQPAQTLSQYEARHGTDWPEVIDWWRRRKAAEGRVKFSTKSWEEAEARILKRTQRA